MKCIYYDEISTVKDGEVTKEISHLHQSLDEMTGFNRALTNYLYALYLQPGVAEAMDNYYNNIPSKKNLAERDSLNQHSATAVMDYFKAKDIMREQRESVVSVAIRAGFMTETKVEGSSVKKLSPTAFKSGEEAFSRAKAFNETSKGWVATPYLIGDVFNVILKPRDSYTQVGIAQVRGKLQTWNDLKTELNSQGIDISKLSDINPELFNPEKMSEAVNYLNRLSKTINKYLRVDDIRALLAIGDKLQSVQSLKSRIGGTDIEVANAIKNILDNPSTVAASFVSLINNVLDKCKEPSTFNFDKLHDVYRDSTEKVADESDEFRVEENIQNIIRKHRCNQEEIQPKKDSIKYLSDITQDTILALQRQLNMLESQEGKSVGSERLRDRIKSVKRALEKKRYYGGLLEFMENAISYIEKANKMLVAEQNSPDIIENSVNKAKAITKVNSLRNAYCEIINDIANLDNNFIDVNLTEEDKNTLINKAKEIASMFDNNGRILQSIAENVIVDVYSSVFSGETFQGLAIADVIKNMTSDSSVMDYLYSLSRVSNPLISGMKRIMDQERRNCSDDLNIVAEKIKRANDKLRKSGIKNTEFMYEFVNNNKGYRIASKYDWEAFYDGMAAAKKAYRKNDFRGVALREMMDAWYVENTVEVEVDPVSHRTERVPMEAYHKNYDFQEGWNDAQKEYYDSLMKLKGQLGTLLPDHMRNQFMPPQLRKAWMDVVRDCVTGKVSLKKSIKILLSKMPGLKHEDDTYTGSRAIITAGSDNIINLNSNYDDTEIRRVPMFFLTKLGEQEDLLQDFSGALQAFAGSAIIHSRTSRVKDLVEMMADYVKDKGVVATDNRGNVKATKFDNGILESLRLVRRKSSSTKTNAIIDAFISRDIYGEKMKDTWINRVGNVLIGYNSYKGLALNMKGAASNFLVGEIQMKIEAATSEYYDRKSYYWANMKVFGVDTITDAFKGKAGDRVGCFRDWVTDDRSAMVNLLSAEFDPDHDNLSKLSRERYNRTWARKFFEDNSLTFGYEVGEQALHLVNMYAILNYEKVRLVTKENGKTVDKIIPLYEAFERTTKVDGNRQLKLKDGAVRIDGSPIDREYLNSIKDNIKTVNQKCHGAMNAEDKGLISRNILGRLCLNFRQWMIEHYSRRFRAVHFEANAGNVLDSNFYNKKVLRNGEKITLRDAFQRIDHADGTFSIELADDITDLKGNMITIDEISQLRQKADKEHHNHVGFYVDMFYIMKDMYNLYKKNRLDGISKLNSLKNATDELSMREKYNIRRALMEMAIIGELTTLSFILGDPDKHKGEFWYRMFMYQVKRLQYEELSSSPILMSDPMVQMLDSPIPAVNTMKGIMYPITGLVHGDQYEYLKSGRNKGMHKYKRNFLKYTLPWWNHVSQMQHFAEEDNLFNVFESSYILK